MKKILIVDDDIDIINLVENRLKKNNYDVVFATDGKSGIKKALDENPDLIIMDVMMPNMYGGEAVKILKTYESTKNIPILFFTAIALESSLTDLAEINVDGKFYPAVTKPFDPNRLLSSIKLMIGE